jgi:hypothetical protein
MTPLQSAQRILTIVVNDLRSRPGRAHSAHAGSGFRSAFSKDEFVDADFAVGAEYAVAQGWLEIVQSSGEPQYRLTGAGFAQGGGVAPPPDECGQRLVSIVVHSLSQKAGNSFGSTAALSVWIGDRFEKEDFERGIGWAIAHGWIERLEWIRQESTWQLTATGFTQGNA